MEQKQMPLAVVCGPTASGKTALAVRLGELMNGEVVCADSMQIYKGMSIATAKPTLEEMREVPHHLVDFLEPEQAFSVAEYAELARETIAQIHGRGRLPILAGGTGLYIQAVTDNIDFSGFAGDPDLRGRLAEEAEILGPQALFERLRQVDPELAASLHPNNRGRVLRALEVYEATGIPMSEHQRRARATPKPYSVCQLGLCFSERSTLYERINRRVDGMLRQGLLEEARQYWAQESGTARQAIGYKELAPYFAGKASLVECVEALKKATRHYAKRQLTWFHKDERVHWLLADAYQNLEQLAREAQNVLSKNGIM